jgi:DedD protein
VPDSSPSLLPPREEALGTGDAIDRGHVERAPAAKPVVETPVAAPPPAPVVETPVAKAPPPAPARPEPEPARPEPPGPAAAGAAGWVVQAGSFSNRENADAVLEALRAGGFPAFVEAADVQGKQVFRVRVGPEADKQRAERMLADMAPVLKAKRLEATLKSYP